MALNIVNGQVVADKGINAPTYNDPFFDFMGQTYQNAAATDPALAMTLGAGNQGGLASGVQAFLPPSANTLFNSAGATGYSDQQLKDLAGSFGYDTPQARHGQRGHVVHAQRQAEELRQCPKACRGGGTRPATPGRPTPPSTSAKTASWCRCPPRATAPPSRGRGWGTTLSS